MKSSINHFFGIKSSINHFFDQPFFWLIKKLMYYLHYILYNTIFKYSMLYTLYFTIIYNMKTILYIIYTVFYNFSIFLFFGWLIETIVFVFCKPKSRFV